MSIESRTVKINFDNENHRNAILKLSEINNKYHYADLFGVINLNRFKNNEVSEKELVNAMVKNDGNDFKVKLMKMEDKDIVGSMKRFMEARFENMSWDGELMVEDKKIIGFIINSWNDLTQMLFIEFILIDKNYRKKGYGTKLIKKIQEKSKEMKCCLGTQPDDIINRQWYKTKFNFKEYNDCRDIFFTPLKKDRDNKIYYHDEEVYKLKLEELNGNDESALQKREFFRMAKDIEENFPDKAEMFFKLTSELIKLRTK